MLHPVRLPAPSALDKLVRTELACAAAYEKALAHVRDGSARFVLRQNRRSHATRASMLSHHVELQGGTPSESAGAWGAFTRWIEGAASLISERAVLEALRLGERNATNTYKHEIQKLGQRGAPSAVRQALREQLDCEERLDGLIAA